MMTIQLKASELLRQGLTVRDFNSSVPWRKKIIAQKILSRRPAADSRAMTLLGINSPMIDFALIIDA